MAGAATNPLEVLFGAYPKQQAKPVIGKQEPNVEDSWLDVGYLTSQIPSHNSGNGNGMHSNGNGV